MRNDTVACINYKPHKEFCYFYFIPPNAEITVYIDLRRLDAVALTDKQNKLSISAYFVKSYTRQGGSKEMLFS